MHLLAFPLVADDLLKLEVDPVVALGIDLVPRVDRLLARSGPGGGLGVLNPTKDGEWQNVLELGAISSTAFVDRVVQGCLLGARTGTGRGILVVLERALLALLRTTGNWGHGR